MSHEALSEFEQLALEVHLDAVSLGRKLTKPLASHLLSHVAEWRSDELAHAEVALVFKRIRELEVAFGRQVAGQQFMLTLLASRAVEDVLPLNHRFSFVTSVSEDELWYSRWVNPSPPGATARKLRAAVARIFAHGAHRR